MSTNADVKALEGNLNKLQKLVDVFKAKNNPQDFEVEGFANNVNALTARLQDNLHKLKTSAVVPLSAEPEKTTDTIEAGKGFAEFLSDIGESVVRSQEALDQQSLNYLRKIEDLPMIPRTMFRIPKISAEFKLGIETKGTEKVNVLIFSKESEAKKINQQNIQLEIAAVPVTPEFYKTIDNSTPKVEFVFNRNLRATLFDAIAKAVNTVDTKLKKQINLLLAPENKNKVILWATSEERKYIVLFADGKPQDGNSSENTKVGVWLLDEKKKTVEPVMRYDLKAKPLEQQGHLQRFVLNLAKKQAAILNA